MGIGNSSGALCPWTLFPDSVEQAIVCVWGMDESRPLQAGADRLITLMRCLVFCYTEVSPWASSIVLKGGKSRSGSCTPWRALP